MPRQDLKFIAEVLVQAVEGSARQSRLQNGVNLRQQMHVALATGQPFSHYRLKWVSSSIDRLVDTARGICKEFDDSHPDDMASSMDLIDMFRGALNLIAQQAGVDLSKS